MMAWWHDWRGGTTTPPPTDVRRHRIAIVAAPAVLAVMYPVFRLTGHVFGGRADGYLAWAAGLAVYWLLWASCSRCGRWVGRRYESYCARAGLIA